MSLTLLPGAEPDDIDLELLLLGVATEPADLLQIRKAIGGPLSREAAELDAARARFQRDALPLRPVPRQRPWETWMLTGVGLLLAALVVLFALQPAPDGLRRMGSELPVDLLASRSGELLESLDSLRADDVLVVRLTSPIDGWVNVGMLQEDGEVFPLVFDVDRAALRGQIVQLDQALRLDAFAGREWLVVHVSPRPMTEEAWSRALFELQPDEEQAAEGWFVHEVTRAP